MNQVIVNALARVFFYKLDEVGNNANIIIRGFTMGKQKYHLYHFVTPSAYSTPGFQVQHSPF